MAWYDPTTWSVKGIVAQFRATDAELVERVFSTSTVSGKAVNEESTLRVSAAWACQRILTEAHGCLPWGIYSRGKSGNAELAVDHPLFPLFAYSPNAEQDPVQFKECIGLGLVTHGNRYFKIDRTGAAITQLIPIWNEVEVFRKGALSSTYTYNTPTKLNIPDGTIFFRVKLRNGQYEDYPREDIWHIKGFGNGLTGLSPIAAAREEIGAALAAEDFGSRFFAQGGMPAGTVTIPQWLSKDQRAIARNNLQQLMGGFGNAHKFVLFEGGMKPEAWGAQNLQDMQFITVRKFTVNEICRFYRIPPHMVADLDRATFSNIEHLSQEFVTFTLMPYLTRIEAAFNRWLLKPEEWGKFFLRFNYEGLLRADSAGRASFYSQALQNGWMNRNEVRAKENLNRVDGLDDYTVQVNMTPVDQLADAISRSSQPKPIPTQPTQPTKDFQPTVSVILPQSLRYEIEAGGMKHALNEFSIGVRALVDRIEGSQREVVKEVAKGNRSVTRSLVEGLEQTAKQLDDHQTTILSSVVSANTSVMEGHKQLEKAMRAKRRVTVGDEVFTSEVLP